MFLLWGAVKLPGAGFISSWRYPRNLPFILLLCYKHDNGGAFYWWGVWLAYIKGTPLFCGKRSHTNMKLIVVWWCCLLCSKIIQSDMKLILQLMYSEWAIVGEEWHILPGCILCSVQRVLVAMTWTRWTVMLQFVGIAYCEYGEVLALELRRRRRLCTVGCARNSGLARDCWLSVLKDKQTRKLLIFIFI